jgi:hypothetical protein
MHFTNVIGVRLKQIADWIKEWFGYMSGALSIPFAFLAALNVGSQRLLFGILAYCGLWILVLAQHKKISDLTAASDDEVESCVTRACELLQEPKKYLWSFNAICGAGADQLRRNEQVVILREQLIKYGHDDPFAGLEDYVPQKDWLQFIKTAVRRPDILTDARHGDYLKLAEKWPEMQGNPKPTGHLPLALTTKAHMIERRG